MRNNQDFGNTKIICTIGPASSSVDMLVALINAGMDVARLNFSHGRYEEHLEVIRNVREACRRTKEHVTILQDLSGPKIRTGRLKESPVELIPGAQIRFTIEEMEGTADLVSTTYKELPRDVNAGDAILLDDGKLRVRVLSTTANEVICEVEIGGPLSHNKGMNLPGVRLSTPSFTPKDVEDLKFGLANDIDYVALSFVRTPNDIRMLRDVIRRECGHTVPVVAKIEMIEAVQNINLIVAESDAVMVARGDLGVELPTENVPMIQKRIVRKCNEAGIPVIIATQMLESMIGNPRPTRAEASDVANAVLDGADAVMLSAETSVGKYPLETVQVMDRIIRRVELERKHKSELRHEPSAGEEALADAVAHAACILARQVHARAIVPITHSGATALKVSKYRPQAKIIAATRSERVLRTLNIVWGVRGIIVPDMAVETDAALATVKAELKKSGYVKSGDYVVFTAGIPLMARGTTDTIKVEQVD